MQPRSTLSPIISLSSVRRRNKLQIKPLLLLSAYKKQKNTLSRSSLNLTPLALTLQLALTAQLRHAETAHLQDDSEVLLLYGKPKIAQHSKSRCQESKSPRQSTTFVENSCDVRFLIKIIKNSRVSSYVGFRCYQSMSFASTKSKSGC